MSVEPVRPIVPSWEDQEWNRLLVLIECGEVVPIVGRGRSTVLNNQGDVLGAQGDLAGALNWPLQVSFPMIHVQSRR